MLLAYLSSRILHFAAVTNKKYEGRQGSGEGAKDFRLREETTKQRSVRMKNGKKAPIFHWKWSRSRRNGFETECHSPKKTEKQYASRNPEVFYVFAHG